MEHSLLQQFINALRCIPGVGPKSAQRTAYYLLERDRESALNLATLMQQALERIKHCQNCRMLTENDLCSFCQSPKRDKSLLCIVESPSDVEAIEQTGEYQGHYFVLLGKLSPLDGVGPEQLGLDLLQNKLSEGHITELIIATNPTVEGEATSQFITTLVEDTPNIKISRLAHGIPMGGELEYLDGKTLAFAFSQRRLI